MTHPFATRYAAVLLSFASTAGAQATPVPAPPAPVVVNHVQINRANVFEAAENLSWYAKAMNTLHIVTRERVIARELLLASGVPYDSSTGAESARNLRNLGIFRDVTVDTIRSDSGLTAVVNTYDSWSTQPYTMFKTVGTEVTWGIGLTEKNLLGLNVGATFRYVKDPDRSTNSFAVKLPRFWNDRVGIGGSYETLSDGQRGRVVVDAPFRSLSGKYMSRTEFNLGDENVLQFFNGEEEASDTVRHLYSKAKTNYGWAKRASKDGYLRYIASAQFRIEDYLPLIGDPPDRTFFGEAEFAIETSTPNFEVIRGYRSLGAPEDVDLSTTVRVGAWIAPPWGYEGWGIGPAINATTGLKLPKGFATARLTASALLSGEGIDSGSVTGAIVLALQHAERHSFVFGINGGVDKNPYPGEEFDLGSSIGPRGFPLHAFTGDRMFFVTSEYRVVTHPDIAGLVAVGVAAFVDYGAAWYNGSSYRSGTDYGVGLRLGSIRASSGGKQTRLDLVRRMKNDALPSSWVLVVGSGFVFDKAR